jgi:hypothetical protein
MYNITFKIEYDGYKYSCDEGLCDDAVVILRSKRQRVNPSGYKTAPPKRGYLHPGSASISAGSASDSQPEQCRPGLH